MKRTVRLAVLAAGLASVLALAAAPAASANTPWWQVLTGTRPTDMWEPTDNEQQLTIKNGSAGSAVLVKVKGATVACLGAGGAAKLCPGGVTISTASQLQAALAAAFETPTVQVSGGPVEKGSGLTATFLILTPGRATPVISLASANPVKEAKEIGSGEAKLLSTGGSGRLSLTITNLGDAAVDATETPVEILDQLPQGTIATGVEGFAGAPGAPIPVDCALEGETKVACSFEGVLPPYEAIEVEVLASLTGEPPVAGAPGQVTVSGGNALPASAAQAIKASPDRAPFGFEFFSSQTEEEGGGAVMRAGSHPFQLTTTLQFNSGNVIPGATRDTTIVEQPALPRNLRFDLPAGLVGNATQVPACGTADFYLRVSGKVQNGCGPETAIGVASVTILEPAAVGLRRIAVPIFNLAPEYGEPARFGFAVAPGVPVVIDTSVDPADHYKIRAEVKNASQLAVFLSTSVVIWGAPGDPRHDPSRGWNCAYKFEIGGPCERPGGLGEETFLREPVTCSGPRLFAVELEPWNTPLGSEVERSSSTSPALGSCNQVPFDPAIASSPTSRLAGAPSGLDFRLDMPNSGLSKTEAIAEGQAKKVEVTLPEGMSVNPSQAEGLVGCTPADLARETADSLPGEGCPEASKVGEIQISTPLLKEEAKGSLYVAAPYDNPFNSLIALYMVARIPERGILVKQAGVVRPDPATGRLTTTFDDLPQIPFTTFKLHFREGARAPLVTPPACGKYDITARFTPWSAADPENPAPAEIVTRTSSFAVEHGFDGGACPSGGTPPFHPGLFAGTVNNSAGSFSPFDVRLTRTDGEQEFTNFSLKLPPGVAAKLAGVPFCSDAQIAQATSRTGPHGGQEEIDAPSCPAASQVGRTLAGAGVGASLVYVPGRIYLAGPYHGAPISLVSITSGVAGPFDVGTVVVRFAIKVNPETGEVFLDSTGSDPIPHIVKGIPLHLRDIRAYTDRPNFTLNPTDCTATSTASTVLGSGLDFASAADDRPVTVTSPFQAADCASLPFKPKLSLRLQGGTKRGDYPKLKAFLKMNGIGEAGISSTQVTLPRSEFIANAHFNTICTRVQFKEAGGNGEACPAGSVYGWARAKTPILSDPLEGPIFLRSSEHQLPDVVASLRGQEINVHLVGHVDSVKGQLRNTFETVPDAPVEWASFSFQGGKKGLFENSTNLCAKPNRADVRFTGQNGKTHNYKPAVKVKCGGKKKAKHKRTAR